MTAKLLARKVIWEELLNTHIVYVCVCVCVCVWEGVERRGSQMEM